MQTIVYDEDAPAHAYCSMRRTCSILRELQSPSGALVVVLAALLVVLALGVAFVLRALALLSGRPEFVVTYHRHQLHLQALVVDVPVATSNKVSSDQKLRKRMNPTPSCLAGRV